MSEVEYEKQRDGGVKKNRIIVIADEGEVLWESLVLLMEFMALSELIFYNWGF